MMVASMHILVVTAVTGSESWTLPHFAERGFAVRVARSAEEALRSASEAPPDVVLMDISNADLDGAGVVRSLQALPRDGKPPPLLVVIRSTGTDGDRRISAGLVVDLSLGEDCPCVAGVLVGVMNRFCEFLEELRVNREAPEPDLHPWIDATMHPSHTLVMD